MKVFKTLTLVVILFFGFSILSAGIVNIAADDSIPPTLSLIAEYNPVIGIDGDYDEWNKASEGYFDIFEYEDGSAITFQSTTDIITVTINFAYNDTHLFFYMHIPGYYGHVKAADIHFFGKPGQNDGIHMFAYDNTFMDLAFPEEGDDPSPPLPDDDYGGTDDAFCSLVYNDTDGSYFEGSKLIRSGDLAGKDIFLDYGQAIAVEISAWVEKWPYDGGPNWGCMLPDEFRYIRLDIGENLGDPLEIYGGPMFPGTTEGSTFQAPFVEDSIVINGEADESAWNDAMEYVLTLSYLNWSTGMIDTSQTWDVTVLVCHDGIDMYFFFDLHDEEATSGDWIGLVIGKSVDMFNNTDGTDFAMMGSMDYLDAYIPGGFQEPTADTEVGGVSNGQANCSYTGTRRQVEFSKPLNSGDAVGRDWSFTSGDVMYITVVLAQNSYEGPNYFDLKEIDGKPHFVVHPVKLLNEGEQPTDEGNNDGNTFTLGFGVTDILIIAASISPILAIVYLRKKK